MSCYELRSRRLRVEAQKPLPIFYKDVMLKSYVYAFSQQSNPDCHLQMWTNFQLLQHYRSKDAAHKVSLDENDLLTHRQWLGKSFPNFYKWMQTKQGPELSSYFEEAINEAPLYPYFYQKDANFFSASYNPIETAERRIFSPFFMKEARQSELSYLLPIYEESGFFYCYDVETEKYEKIECESVDQLLTSDFTTGQQKALPSHLTNLHLKLKNAGRRSFVQACDLSMAVQDKFIPRELGPYKLLLLNLGLNHLNETIEADHPDFLIFKEMQIEMENQEINWKSDVCKKEHLIEYALAEIFKENDHLLNKVKKHVDFYFKTWSRFEDELTTLVDQEGNPLKDKKIDRFLPGTEQMLAYCLMKNVQYLWLTAISSTAFCHHLGLPSFVQFISCIVGPSRYCQAAYEKKEGESFIDLWKEIRGELIKKFPCQQDWVSFSGHGMVISFDSDLIEQQNQCKIKNLQLAEELGIAGIDSLYGKEMDLFYRRSS
jgi:hypothetical protein